jgi:putative spermidine/putrescine transport system substrate-binding protein
VGTLSPVGGVRALGLVLVTALALVAASCSIGDDGSPTTEIDGLGSSVREIRALARAEARLELVAWPGYVDPASTGPFARQTGCMVNVTEATDTDEMLSLFRSGDYDGVSASGDISGLLMSDGDVAPIDPELVPNYDVVQSGVKNRAFNSRDGRPYGMPIGRAANLLVFRTDTAPEDTESWSVIWDDARRYTGRLSIPDDAMFIADAAKYLQATRPRLGIEDPYQLDEQQFRAALRLLRAQAPYVGEYWARGDSAQVESFRSGESALGTTRPERLPTMEAAGIPLMAVKPVEGVTGWSDTWMVASHAANPNCMYLWMDYAASPEVQARFAESQHQAPVNLVACQLMKDPDGCTSLHAADDEWWEDIDYWTTPSEDCGDPAREEACKTLDDWKAAWADLRG